MDSPNDTQVHYYRGQVSMLDYLLRAVPLSTLEASLTANRPLQPYMDEEITHV